jgi:hypothetical protein
MDETQTDTTSENIDSPIKRLAGLRNQRKSTIKKKKSVKKRNDFRDLIRTPFRKKSIKRSVLFNSDRR